MALVNLKTDLKSLKFGRDRLGGGSSGQPYITKDIPDDLTPTNFLESLTGADFIVRGGALSLNRTIEDNSRIAKLFADTKSPNGLVFIGKQELLSRQNPKTGAEPNRIYNPLNTIATIDGTAFGNHFNKEGLLPIIAEQDKYLSKTQNDYNTFAINDSGGYEITNKLGLLYHSKILGINQSGLQNQAEPFGVELFNKDLLFQYDGGPNSFLGVTQIRRYEDTIGDANIPGSSNRSALFQNQNAPQDQKFILYDNVLLGETDGIGKGAAEFGNTGIRNFLIDLFNEERSGVSQERKNQIIGDPINYSTFNRAKTFGEGNPGLKGKNKFAYYTTSTSTPTPDSNIFQEDKVNAKVLYNSNSNVAKTGEGYDDLIKFNIGVIDNDSTDSNPRNTTWIHFRAFLDSFTDNYNPTWNAYNFTGRGDKFYQYEGFTRDINLSFKVAAQSRYEMGPMYEKLNYLASVTTPDYSDSGFMRGNIIRLTIGDYLNSVYGILTGLTYSIPNNSSWDIARTVKGEVDSNGKELPHIIEVSQFNFTPIHNFISSKVKNNYVVGDQTSPNSQYISMGEDGVGYSYTQEARKVANQTTTT